MSYFPYNQLNTKGPGCNVSEHFTQNTFETFSINPNLGINSPENIDINNNHDNLLVNSSPNINNENIPMNNNENIIEVNTPFDENNINNDITNNENTNITQDIDINIESQRTPILVNRWYHNIPLFRTIFLNNNNNNNSDSINVTNILLVILIVVIVCLLLK